MDSVSFYITGIGASAGGTNALKSFFENIGDEPETAFIIIQHLAPNQNGFTKEVIKGSTNLPITQVNKKTKVEKNQIYIIPPTHFLLLEDQHLILKPRAGEKKINDAIDVFFHSLAQQASEKAIGIILSGLGSDGAKGAQMIKERGGIIMVQSPDTANFSSMPLEAIISDHPDVIGSPEKLAKDLLHFTKHPSIISPDSEKSDKGQEGAIEKIISLVNEFSGVNFRDYKRNTIIRRIDKRIKINYLDNTYDYFKFLGEKPDEIRVLYNDLLIGVTEFFRDKEAFDVLAEKVIPELFRTEKNFAAIRVWVAGCSSGEEAYSLAMLLDEYIKEKGLHQNFKIFATDLDQKAIELARRGRFSKQIELQVPETFLNNYFIQRGDYYEVNNELRNKVIFSVHNLLNDPPFIRVDLITCRNLFIYLKPEIQKKVFYTFNYALRNNGFLMIGAHEANADFTDLFEAVDNRWKIYRNKDGSAGLKSEVIRSASFSNLRYREIKVPARPNPAIMDQQQEFFAELLLEKYAPDCMLLSENNEVVYVTGNAEEYLRFPKRRANLKLFDMVKGSTSLALRNGLRKIKEVQRNVVLRNINAITNKEANKVVDLFFYSIYSSSTAQKYILVEIKPADKNEDDQEFTEISSRENLKEIERLEAELYQTRKELEFSSDELETINEELQSSNEEMKSSNEEMQTTNEELQSSNEELKTVNYELKSKMDELTVLHADVHNLFVSTQIATLFLDRDLKIRKFTPGVQSYFNVRESDIGRPIYHYTYNFDYRELEIDVEKVLQTLHPLQKEVATSNGYALIKIIPYKTDNMRIDGIIITFVDVNQLKETNLKLEQMTSALQKRTAELEHSEKYWKLLVENTPDIVARFDKNATILFANQSLITHTGIEAKRLIGKSIFKLKRLCNEAGIKQLYRKFHQAIKNKKVLNFYQDFTSGGGTETFFITLIPEASMDDGYEHVILIARDITDLRSVETKVEEKNRRLEDMNQYMDNFVHAVAHDLRSPLTNLKLILDLISDEENAVKRELLVGKLDNAVMRIDDIINGLIEIIDTQVKISEKERNMKFSSVVDKVLEQFKEEIPKDAKINLNFEVEEITHIRGYVFSVIRNLLSNCFQYRKDDVPLEINIETKKEGLYTVLSIRDNGIGMDFEEIKNDLFKPFQRFTSGGEGKGIGLHLIKSMIEKTGGKIEVDSELGKGTTFFIYFKEKKSEYSFN